MKERVAALRAEPEPEDLGLSVVVDPEESADRAAFSPVDEQLEVKFCPRMILLIINFVILKNS